MSEKMNSKQRVLTAIRHEEPDRVPLNIWLYLPGLGSEELKAEIEVKYGSLDEFYEAFGIDLVMDMVPFPYKDVVWGESGTFITGIGGVAVEEITDEHFHDPDDESLYAGLKQLVQTHGDEKAVVAHVWGLVYPNDKLIVDVVKRRGKPAAMHNDGNIWRIMDGIVEMGIDMLHPLQTSAGMDLIEVKQKYGHQLTIHGGLDVSHVLPRSNATWRRSSRAAGSFSTPSTLSRRRRPWRAWNLPTRPPYGMPGIEKRQDEEKGYGSKNDGAIQPPR